MALKSSNNLSGVPLWYPGGSSYVGQWWGKPHSFTFEETFLFRCAVAVYELTTILPSPYNGIHHITSLGTLAGVTGEHAKGKAIDIAAVFFKDNGFVIVDWYDGPFTGAARLVHRRRYLALEAVWRRFFSYIDNRYDPKHQNHWHGDTVNPYDANGAPIFNCPANPKGCRRSCWFIQEAWNQIWRYIPGNLSVAPAVKRTGEWDASAKKALSQGIARANKAALVPGTIVMNRGDWWPKFCLATAKIGIQSGLTPYF